MRLDVIEVARRRKRPVVPVQLPQPPVPEPVNQLYLPHCTSGPMEARNAQVDRRVSIADRAEVALEVTDVDGIEADDGDEQPDVRLGEPAADKVVLVLQYLLEPVERLEERNDRRLVRLLRRRKASLVHAVCRRRPRQRRSMG